MIVMKFGGSSVGSAEAMQRVARIVAGRIRKRPLVVASAMSGITDALLQVSRACEERRLLEALGGIQAIRDRHVETLDALELVTPEREAAAGEVRTLCSDLETLARGVATLGELTPRSRDALAAFGEALSCRLLAAALRKEGLPARFEDSRGLLVTDPSFGAASPNFLATERRCRETALPALDRGQVLVTQGFVGATLEGITTTLGRGGSDYSAATFGSVMGAETIEIWTDVDGMMTADPRVVPDARRIREVSFDEAAELSYFGAKVLHPSTVLPAVERGIPVQIFNTWNPEGEGTRITAQPTRCSNLIKSIAMKRGITVLNVSSTRMLQAHGFLRTLFDVFERHATAVDVVTTSEVSVSMTIDDTRSLEAIRRELEAIGKVSVESGMAIVCVVGDGLRGAPGAVARIFGALGGTAVHMVSQGASEINLTFVVQEGAAHEVVRSLHREMFQEVDEAVFA